MNRKAYIGIVCVLFFIGCNKKGHLADKSMDGENTSDQATSTVDVKNMPPLSPMEYAGWIQDEKNGFNKKKEIDDLTFYLQYKPLDYIVCVENKTESLEDSMVIRRIGELKDARYFDLKIALTEGEGELLKYQLNSAQEYTRRVNYFAFEMQKDIKLVEGGDTVDCAMFHFERGYDATPYSKFLLAFPLSKKNAAKEKTIVFNDRIFNKGIIKFTYTENKLSNLPKLKTL